MASKGFVSPHVVSSGTSSYVSPHFDGKKLKDFSNVTGDPFSLDGLWKSNQGFNITIKDNYVMDYPNIPPRHIDFLGSNRIGFNVGTGSEPTGDVIGGDTVVWNTTEKWEKIGAVPSGITAPSGKINWLLYGGIGVATLAILVVIFRRKKSE